MGRGKNPMLRCGVRCIRNTRQYVPVIPVGALAPIPK